MEAEIARGIVEAAEADGLDVTLYEDYGGRGMFGHKTTGVVGSWPDFTNAVIGYLTTFNAEEFSHKVDEVREEIRVVNTDSMGRSNLIFY